MSQAYSKKFRRRFGITFRCMKITLLCFYIIWSRYAAVIMGMANIIQISSITRTLKISLFGGISLIGLQVILLCLVITMFDARIRSIRSAVHMPQFRISVSLSQFNCHKCKNFNGFVYILLNTSAVFKEFRNTAKTSFSGSLKKNTLS